MNIKQHAANIRKNILQCGNQYGRAHFGGSLSMADLMAVLFANFIGKGKDRFILGKGHCALALYATLAEFDYISKEELMSFNANGGDFPSHCVKNREKGIELSSGSLGLGLSFAVGEALALKDKNDEAKLYVVCGNGELNEGSFWEAAMFAGHKNVNNIVLIVDYNKFQNDGASELVMPVENWADKLKAFNWGVIEIDGHDISQIEKALQQKSSERPIAIVAHTIKGKGVSFMENNGKWHHNNMTPEQFENALIEIGASE